MEQERGSLRDRPAILMGAGIAVLGVFAGAVVLVLNTHDKSASQAPKLDGYDLVMSEAQPNGGRMMLLKAQDGQSTAIVFISPGTTIGPGFNGQMPPGLGQGPNGVSAYESQADDPYSELDPSTDDERYNAPESPLDETGQAPVFDDPASQD